MRAPCLFQVGSAEVLEEPTDLIVGSDEGEAHVVFGPPQQDSLGKSRANFPQLFPSQLRQTKASRKLLSGHGPDEEINASFDFQLLDGVEALEAALEGRVEGIPHSQAPEMPKRCVLGAERPPAVAALGQTGQEGELLIGEAQLRDDGGSRQQNPPAFNHEAHRRTLPSEPEGLSDWLGQSELTVRPDLGCNDFVSRGHLPGHLAFYHIRLTPDRQGNRPQGSSWEEARDDERKSGPDTVKVPGTFSSESAWHF
jgi:hypothetical protein